MAKRDAEARRQPTGDEALLALRVDARRALPAHAPARRLRLGHRRLLVPRHHARRRDADRRAVGDERLPQGAARQDRRHQRPYLRRADRQPADRLRRGGRSASPAVPGVRRAIPLVEGQAFGSSQYSGSGVLVRGVRAEDLQQDRAYRGQHPAGHARGFRRRRGRRHRPAPRRIPVAAGRRHVHADHAARRVDALRHRAARQGLSGEGGVRDRHVGVRLHLRVHAARGGAELLQPPRRRAADRGLSRQCRPGRRGARGHRGGGGPADRA